MPLTYPRVGCKCLCKESSRGGYVIGPLDQLAVFYEARRGLSYLSYLTACITGLVVMLVPFHTTATGLTLHDWRVAQCQKHTFGEKAPLTLQEPDV